MEPKGGYRVHMNPLPVRILNLMNPVHTSLIILELF
jgi:hypothetical protein